MFGDVDLAVCERTVDESPGILGERACQPEISGRFNVIVIVGRRNRGVKVEFFEKIGGGEVGCLDALQLA